MNVATLKQKIVAKWPQGKTVTPKSINDLKIIHAGKVIENNKTLADSRITFGDLPAGVITMHVIVQPDIAKNKSGLSSSPYIFIDKHVRKMNLLGILTLRSNLINKPCKAVLKLVEKQDIEVDQGFVLLPTSVTESILIVEQLVLDSRAVPRVASPLFKCSSEDASESLTGKSTIVEVNPHATAKVTMQGGHAGNVLQQ
ncbi:hypothetical protein Golob_012818 [Gossypium lobatum]|uniref:UBL3-like ubiquitin domain-containing protein n=1 Tax=Gossypium lobatum TaxID=34289 RepID=A0A7J8LMI9_9ROSI|nr:hypothetical protein [Gossypium lobatum]